MCHFNPSLINLKDVMNTVKEDHELRTTSLCLKPSSILIHDLIEKGCSVISIILAPLGQFP